MVLTFFAIPFVEDKFPLGSASAGSPAQSWGKVFKPQKFSGRSSRAASLQPSRSESSGWQYTTLPVVSRPSLLWKCTTTPASSFTLDRIEQPCALTTRVSHTSENRAPGSRLVTRIGTLTGTLELRRRVVGGDKFCIVADLYRRSFAALSHVL